LADKAAKIAAERDAQRRAQDSERGA
jgi:hypothetical protein